MRLKIEVTKDDIRLGQRGIANRCPVARAAKRALTAASGCATLQVWVGCGDINVIDTYGMIYSHIAEYAMPKSVGKFIRAFDDYGGCKAVKPFNFYINTEGA